MRVGFVCEYFGPRVGGAELMVVQLCRALRDHDHCAWVMTPAPALIPSVDDICVYRIALPGRSLRTVVSLCQWLQVVWTERPLTVCIGLLGRSALFPILLRHAGLYRLVIYLHGGEVRYQPKRSRVAAWLLRWGLRRADHIIAVSTSLAREAIALCPDAAQRMTVLPNSVPVDEIRSTPPYPHRRDYLLCAARLVEVKDVGTAIRAFGRIAHRLDVDLVIAGAGPERSALESAVAAMGLTGRVLFVGERPRSEVFALLRGCCFLLLSSWAEGCPLIVLEALAAGKLVLGSRVKGIVELVVDGNNGALFERGADDELALLIERYYTDPPERERLEANIRGSDPPTVTSLAATHFPLYQT